MSKINATQEELKLPFAEFTIIHPNCSRMQYSRLRAKAGLNKSYNATKTVLKPQEAQVKQPKPIVEQPKAAKAAVEAPASSGDEIDIDSILGMDESECQTAQLRKNEKNEENDVTENVTSESNVTKTECNISDSVNELNESILTLKSVPEKGVEEDVRDVTIDVTNQDVTLPKSLKPLTKYQEKWGPILIDEVLHYGSPATSCNNLGCNYSMYLRWVSPNSSDYWPEFCQAIKNSQQMFDSGDEEACLDAIRKHQARYWQAAAWLLERRHPERYAKREGISVGVGLNLNLSVTQGPGQPSIAVKQAAVAEFDDVSRPEPK